VSSSIGNDSYSEFQAQNKLTPWKSIKKINSIMQIIRPGDSILFKRGDVFSGTLKIGISGWGKNVVIGAYGEGVNPEIIGLYKLHNWEMLQSNVWVADYNTKESFPGLLLIDGEIQQIGRYPNAGNDSKGYIPIVSHKGKNQIFYDNKELNNVNWTGADIIVRTKRWILDKASIKQQANNSFVFSKDISYEPIHNFGFFIQNSLQTLDEEGEWYYDDKQQKIYLYFTKNPSNRVVEVSSIPTLVDISNQGNITIENLVLNGASKNAMEINVGYNLEIRNLKIINTATNGIYATSSRDIAIIGNIINNTCNNALQFNYCNNVSLKSNTIKNTALREGMGLGGEAQYNALYLSGSGYLVENNRIDSVGYNGIFFLCNSITIKNNYISNYCLVKDDGGGIYTFPNAGEVYTDQRIIGNIICNGMGAPQGTPYLDNFSNGIYIDDNSANIEILQNTIFNCSYSGIYIRNSSKIAITGNTLFDNRIQLNFFHDSTDNTYPITECSTTNNILFSNSFNQYNLVLSTIKGSISDIGEFDNNYYSSVWPENNIIVKNFAANNFKFKALSLSEWKGNFHKDENSTWCPFRSGMLKINSIKSKNLLFNGEIRNLKNWYCWSVYGNCEMEKDKEMYRQGIGLKLSFRPITGKPGSKLFAIPNTFPVKKNKNYLVYFKAKSSKPGLTFTINFRKEKNTLNELDREAYFKLDTLTKAYLYAFTPADNDNHARIEFELQETKESVWLGDVSVFEAEIQPSNSDGFLKFEVNTGKHEKRVKLNDVYIDVNNIEYADEVIIKPFSSVILFKKSGLFNDENLDISGFAIPKSKKNTDNYFYFILAAVLFAISGLIILKKYGRK
jgi:parallel beta-helix repeat protein